VTSYAAYPRQPFDFAGRTGTIVFDVSNDSQGSHAAWPELWVTDQPTPDPFTHENTLESLPRNGFGIRFAGCTNGSGTPSPCPRGNGTDGVDSAIVVNNYQEDDSFNGGNLLVAGDGSIVESASGSGQMNHYEIQVSATRIDVYGTDPFTPGQTVPPLRHLSTISNFGTLGFTRGLVWIEDAHYNANKFNNQGTHTFRWDNVGFDGPVLPRDLGFDVPANKQPEGGTAGNGEPGNNGAYSIGKGATVTVPAVTNIDQASGALLVFNMWSLDGSWPPAYKVTFNGQALNTTWPYSPMWNSTLTVALSVPLADIVAGNNTVTFTDAGGNTAVSNIDLILQGAGG
jgi:hypothetical protein